MCYICINFIFVLTHAVMGDWIFCMFYKSVFFCISCYKIMRPPPKKIQLSSGYDGEMEKELNLFVVKL